MHRTVTPKEVFAVFALVGAGAVIYAIVWLRWAFVRGWRKLVEWDRRESGR